MLYRNYRFANSTEVAMWAKEKPKVYNYVNFDGLDFSNMDLSGMRFRKCSFYKCKFVNTKLCHTDLYGSYMCCSDFTNADMTFANIRYCKFTGSTFNNCTFRVNNLKHKYDVIMGRTSNLTKDQLDIANIRSSIDESDIIRNS